MAGKALLEKQAKHIEALLALTSNSMEILRDPTALKQALRTERDRLLGEVAILKEALLAAQIKNGKKQVFSSFLGDINSNQSEAMAPPIETLEKLPEEAPAKSEKQKEKAPKTKGKAPAKSNQQPPVPEVVDVSRLDMRIGLITEATKHPDADNLYIEKVNVGDEKIRTVVSGLAKHVPLEAMQNRLCIFMCNLKPAKLKGIFSEAMVMCANNEGTVEILTPPLGCKPGDRITVPGYPGQPDSELNPKKKIWEQVMPDLRTDASGKATYKGVHWTVEGCGEGYCHCKLADAQIK